jgi:hypothetical protein
MIATPVSRRLNSAMNEAMDLLVSDSPAQPEQTELF